MMTIQNNHSLSRLFRQLAYIPWLHNRWLTVDVKAQLKDKITQAEIGHQGEIMLIIENHLPIESAYHMDARSRAVTLFGTHQVWDTEHNTGVLVYVNLCQKELHIIADRGINQKAQADTWQTLYQNAQTAFKQAQYKDGLLRLIDEIGQVLRTHYPSDDINGNELANDVVFLK